MEKRRDIALCGRYLNLPVKTGQAKCAVRVMIDGQCQRQFLIELADEQPDFWAFTDVSEWQGKTATLVVDCSLPDAPGLEAVQSADDIIGAETLYQEELRQPKSSFEYPQERFRVPEVSHGWSIRLSGKSLSPIDR